LYLLPLKYGVTDGGYVSSSKGIQVRRSQSHMTRKFFCSLVPKNMTDQTFSGISSKLSLDLNKSQTGMFKCLHVSNDFLHLVYHVDIIPKPVQHGNTAHWKFLSDQWNWSCINYTVKVIILAVWMSDDFLISKNWREDTLTISHFANDWKTISKKIGKRNLWRVKPFVKFVNVSSTSNFPLLQYFKE
jgi:hypothetical protein